MRSYILAYTTLLLIYYRLLVHLEKEKKGQWYTGVH